MCTPEQIFVILEINEQKKKKRKEEKKQQQNNHLTNLSCLS